MSLPRWGKDPKGRAFGHEMLPLSSLAMMVAMMLGGCASTTKNNATYVWPGSEPSQVAAVPQPRKSYIEEDGHEAQLPPLKKAKQEPDDPSEPWSPNYGMRTPVVVSARPPATPAIPADLPPAFRQRLAEAVQDH